MVAKRARARGKAGGGGGGGALRDLRAEVERLKRKIDVLEAELRRLRRPVRPAFPDVGGGERDESE